MPGMDIAEARMPLIKMYTTEVCPFCHRAKALLRQRGVQRIEEIRVDLHPEQRDAMIRITGRRTVPQIFIDERSIGGFEELAALDAAGKLAELHEPAA